MTLVKADTEDSFLLAFKLILKDAKEKNLREGNGGQSTLICPICKGTIRYTVASCNGHIWAKCSTEDCLIIIQ